MTARLAAALEILRSTFASVDSLDPADQDVVYASVLSHVRARRPESCGVLGTLPAPTEAIRDPRAR